MWRAMTGEAFDLFSGQTQPAPPLEIPDEVLAAFSDRAWRLSNLYFVQDEYGTITRFALRPAQAALLADMHYLNIILKARQLGFSTFILLLALDCCVFNDHFHAGLIADTTKNAQNLLQRIRFAYEHMPEEIQQHVQLLAANSLELRFSNGSTVEVGVSLRSSTKNFLHISEYGKICAKTPDKAKEVKTGSLNTLAPGQLAFIESTAEGKGGDFFEKVQAARAIADNKRAPADLEWKFHFYPWFLDPKYSTEQRVALTPDEEKYFTDLEAEHGITLTPQQEWWYALKAREQGDGMTKEFPSTPDEAFAGATDGAVLGKQFRAIRKLGYVGRFPYVPGLPVNTFWDFGLNDMQTIWLHQEVAGRHRFVGYYENNNIGLAHYFDWLTRWAAQRGAVFGKHCGPHDLTHKRQGLQARTIKDIASEVGFEFTRVNRSPDKWASIETARKRLYECDFDEAQCAKGIAHLEGASREWDGNNSVWLNEMRHDDHSHGLDGWLTFSDGYKPEPAQKPLPPPPPAPRSLQGSLGR